MTIQNEQDARSFFFRLATALAIVVLFAVLARAGGPEYVAGSSYFNSSTMGQPLTWSLGQVNYYTDQGDLSPILPNNSANVLVAERLQPMDFRLHRGVSQPPTPASSPKT